MFKYSAYKNLASLAENDSDEDKAVDFYLEVHVFLCNIAHSEQLLGWNRSLTSIIISQRCFDRHFPNLYSGHKNYLFSIDLTDYSFFTQWPRFRVKHLLEFVRSRNELQPCY